MSNSYKTMTHMAVILSVMLMQIFACVNMAAAATSEVTKQLPVRYRVLILQDESYSMSSTARPSDPYGLRHLLAGFTADILELSGPPNQIGLSIFGSRLDEVVPIGNAYRDIRQKAVYFDPRSHLTSKSYLERSAIPMGMLTDYRHALALETKKVGSSRTVTYKGVAYRLEPVIILLTDGPPQAWPGDPVYGNMAREYLQAAAARRQPGSRYPGARNFPAAHYKERTTAQDRQWFQNELRSKQLQINALAWGKDAPTGLLKEITLAAGGRTAVFATADAVHNGIQELQDALKKIIVTPDNILSLGRKNVKIASEGSARIKSFSLPRGTERVLVRVDLAAQAIALLKHGKTLSPQKVQVHVNGVTLTPRNANFYYSISRKLKEKGGNRYRKSLLAISYIQIAEAKHPLDIRISNSFNKTLPVSVSVYAARQHFPRFDLQTEPKRILNNGTPAFCKNDPITFTFQILGADKTPYPLRSVSYQMWSKTGAQSAGELSPDPGPTLFKGTDIPVLEGTTAITLSAAMAEGSNADTRVRVNRKIKTLERKDPHFIVFPLETPNGPIPAPQQAASAGINSIDLTYSPFVPTNKVRGLAPAYAVILDPFNPCFTGPQEAQPFSVGSMPVIFGSGSQPFGTLTAKITGVLHKNSGSIKAVQSIKELKPGDFAIFTLRFKQSENSSMPINAINSAALKQNNGCQNFQGGTLMIGSTSLPVSIRLCLPLEQLKLRVH